MNSNYDLKNNQMKAIKLNKLLLKNESSCNDNSMTIFYSAVMLLFALAKRL